MTDTPLNPSEELAMRLQAFALYCEDREAFCLTAQRLSSWMGIVSGTALIGAARAQSPEFSLGFGALVVALSAAVLVFDLPGLARRHNELRRKAIALACEAESGAELSKIEPEFHKLYADCPITFHAASALATNAIQANRGRTKRLVIRPSQRLVRHFWRFSSTTFTEWELVEASDGRNDATRSA